MFKLNLDGSNMGNPSSGGGGGVLWDSAGKIVFYFSKFFSNFSNNEAELPVI